MLDIDDDGDVFDSDEGDEVDEGGEVTEVTGPELDEGDEKSLELSEEDSDLELEEEETEYLSSYKERMDHTPISTGTWEHDRGESKFIPDDEEARAELEARGMDGIEYKNGIPDFSECAEATVEIDNMTENRYPNFKQCDDALAAKWNEEARDGRTDWEGKDVRDFRDGIYTWHERIDMKTCDLVPRAIHDKCRHLGGVSECKKRDAKTYDDEGDVFDED